MNLRQAAQQTLGVLETYDGSLPHAVYREIRNGLRAALDQQPQIMHADGCWSWGPLHYQCALDRLGEQERRLAALRQTVALALPIDEAER